jgi:hypothetical protein
MFEPLPDFKERVRRLFMIRSTLQRSDTVKGRERLSLKSNARSLRFKKFAKKALF